MQEISLHIMDLVQNSITASATYIKIGLEVSKKEDTLKFFIEDNGIGMDEAMLAKVESPFTTTRTTRKVGLGISLFKAGCEGTGGEFKITSKLGQGTALWGKYILSHIDRPPLGDYAGTVHNLIVCNPSIDFELTSSSDTEEFELNTVQIRQMLGEEVPLSSPEVSIWIQEYIQEGLSKILGGANI